MYVSRVLRRRANKNTSKLSRRNFASSDHGSYDTELSAPDLGLAAPRHPHQIAVAATNYFLADASQVAHRTGERAKRAHNHGYPPSDCHAASAAGLPGR